MFNIQLSHHDNNSSSHNPSVRYIDFVSPISTLLSTKMSALLCSMICFRNFIELYTQVNHLNFCCLNLSWSANRDHQEVVGYRLDEFIVKKLLKKQLDCLSWLLFIHTLTIFAHLHKDQKHALIQHWIMILSVREYCPVSFDLFSSCWDICQPTLVNWW